MHILSASRNAIELTLLPSGVLEDEHHVPVVTVTTETAAPAVTEAARTFLAMNAAGRAVRSSVGRRAEPPPAVFRENRSGLLRMVHREAVIRFRRGTAPRLRRSILDKFGFQVRSQNAFVRDQLVVFDPEWRHAGANMLDVVNEWAAMDEVVFAVPNFVSQYKRGQQSSIHREQWHLANAARVAGQKRGEDVGIKDAWKITRGSRKIVVAVLDDGVDVAHPNLRAAIVKTPDPDEPRDRFGRDFFIPDDEHPDHFDPRPKRFRFPFDRMAGNDIHGTPCAGVIAARGVKGGGIGVAPRCRILPVKIFHADAMASDARVADAIRYAGRHADILSCSWSGPFSTDIELAIQDVAEARGGKGAAVFCAAGNDFGEPVGYPAALPDAIAVGASTDQGKLADYSNVGPEIAFVAPSSGGLRGIYTTDVSNPGRGFNTGSAAAGGADGLHTNDFGGTSSATPLAAGIAALLLSREPKLDRVALREIMAQTADRIGPNHGANGKDPGFGHGRVHAAKALSKI